MFSYPESRSQLQSRQQQQQDDQNKSTSVQQTPKINSQNQNGTGNQIAQQQQSNQEKDAVILDHVIGYSGLNFQSIVMHPKINNLFLYSVGAMIIIEDSNVKNKQEFLRGHDMNVTAIAVSSSGRFLASGQQGTIYAKVHEAPVILWDLAQLKIITVFKGLKNGITHLLFSPDEKFLVSLLCWDKVTQIGKYPCYSFIVALGGQLQMNKMSFDLGSMQFNMHTVNFQYPSSGLVRNFTTCFIKDDHFFVGTQQGEICIFFIPNLIFKAALPIATNGVLSICNLDNYIFVGSGDGKLKRLVGQETKWVLEAEVQLEGKVNSIRISQDTKTLLSGTSAAKMYMLYTQSLDAMVLKEGHSNSVNDIALLAQNNQILAGIDSNGFIIVWDLMKKKIMTKCFPPNQGMNGTLVKGMTVKFSDDNCVVGGWDDGFIRAFELSNLSFSQVKWEIVNAHRNGVTALYIDSLYILSGGGDAQIRIWSRKNRQLVSQLSVHTKAISAVIPDVKNPQIIHTCSIDKTIHSYNLKTEKKIIFHTANNGMILSMSQRKDSEQELITCGYNIPILFWDCDVQEPVGQMSFPSKLRSIEVSPSGRFLVVGSEQGEIGIYNVQSGQFLGKYLGHSGPVTKVLWVNSEKQIISSSEDSSIAIWNFSL